MANIAYAYDDVLHVARAIADADGEPTVMDHHIRRAEEAIKAVREMDEWSKEVARKVSRDG
jgi:hypothetical protein